MPILLTCPGCQSELRVKDEHAGKKVKCPRCEKTVEVPVAEIPVEDIIEEGIVEAVTADKPQPPARRPARSEEVIGEECPRCGTINPKGVESCQECNARLDKGVGEGADEPRPRRRRPAYVPCPRCGGERQEKVTFTFWGSFYGPAMFNHVRCRKCGYAYNGRTGRSNLLPAILFVTIPGLLISGIIVWVVIMLVNR